MKIRLEKFGEISLINFTDLTADESKLVLAMRNHPDVRKWMYNNQEIETEEHLNFIESLREDGNKQYFLVKQHEKVIGTINFTQIDKHTKSAYFGLYANVMESLPGMGRILEEVSIYYAFECLNLNLLRLEVFTENKQVINLHRKYGFEVVEETKVNKREIVCMQKKLIQEDVE
jgi:UDP-4-amino-4,6-dideoxy-N-acetyl-beta-L-altrosamine N-acetyltransferase